ncbi:MAG: permease-like cell division protein FtsX [Bacteroidales bacterium]|nr:permease-like cell division protein FtsX [Bacteroidales bacterium]
MAKQNNQAATRKLRSSYFTTTISISLVLFLLGMIGLLLLNANRLSNYVKENLGLMVMIENDAKEAEVKRIEKTLSASPMVKSVTYLDKESAAEQLKAELGEDFVDFVGYNPLLSSIDVKLYADFATEEGMKQIETLVIEYPEVKEVHYQKDMVNLIHENVNIISMVLLAFSGLMLIVAITLINNTVRLMVYSKRFLIRTMQLVGATNGFIRRPFVGQSVAQGLIGGFIANLLLAGVIYLSTRELSGVIGFDNIMVVVVLFAIVFIIGIIITLISTLVSVNRYLSIRTADLYV